MSIRAQNQPDRSFLKNVWHGTEAPSGVHYKEKNVFLPGDSYLESIGVEICIVVKLCPGLGFLQF